MVSVRFRSLCFEGLDSGVVSVRVYRSWFVFWCNFRVILGWFSVGVLLSRRGLFYDCRGAGESVFRGHGEGWCVIIVQVVSGWGFYQMRLCRGLVL